MPQDGSAYKGTGTRRAVFLGACLYLAVLAALSAAVVLSGKSNAAKLRHSAGNGDRSNRNPVANK